MAPDPQNLESGNSNHPSQQNLPIADVAFTEAVTQIEVLDDSEVAEDEPDDMPTIVLPMHLSNLDDAAKTDVGLQREHNEDYYGIAAEIQQIKKPSGGSVQAQGIYILCDGMGGHAGGEVASQLAVETLQNFFQNYWRSQRNSNATPKIPPSQVIREGVLLANQVIFDRNQAEERMGSARMGTTLVMAIVNNTTVAVAHVGDSRLYRYTRKNGLEQVTCDHEVGQREIKRGVLPELAYARPDAYQLTQALGPRDNEFVEPDIHFMEINEDTLFLLASDGLTDNQLLEEYQNNYVAPLISSQANLDQGVRELISLANEYNGHDNITAIVIRAKVRPNLESIRF
ncbi:serine/threonine phosphatase [Alkalinema pantanalense CENA528]|uniref:serine/threonine phosphatase n=1 Tax=Alkalinema pantanalense TaxID=1620705 RepID=UPI003D6FAD67